MRRNILLWDFNQELCSLICRLIDIEPQMEGTAGYRTEFAAGEDDFREVIHPKRDYRVADTAFILSLTIRCLKKNTAFAG